jgi:hypothetical protein
MAKEQFFIPSLDDLRQSVYVDPVDKISYLLGFTLINPGFTSEQLESQMLSLSGIIAKYPDNLLDAALEYERALQDLLNLNCEENYIVQVSKSNVTETDVTFEITVTDQYGAKILSADKMVALLKK